MLLIIFFFWKSKFVSVIVRDLPWFDVVSTSFINPNVSGIIYKENVYRIWYFGHLLIKLVSCTQRTQVATTSSDQLKCRAPLYSVFIFNQIMDVSSVYTTPYYCQIIHIDRGTVSSDRHQMLAVTAGLFYFYLFTSKKIGFCWVF
jgi:hypothetical protein